MQVKQRLMKLTTLTVVNVDDTVKKKTTEANPMTPVATNLMKSHFKRRFQRSIRHRSIEDPSNSERNYPRICITSSSLSKEFGVMQGYTQALLYLQVRRSATDPTRNACQCTTALLQASCKILFQMDARLL